MATNPVMASKVQEAIGQRRPFRSRRQEAVVGLLRTGDEVRRYFGRLVKKHGLTWQQYNVARILRGAGSQGLPTMEIRRRMIEQAPGITRILDRLVERGWVERVPLPEDRRQVICRITPGGLEMLGALDPEIDAADERALAALGGKEVRSLIAVLDRVREDLGS